MPSAISTRDQKSQLEPVLRPLLMRFVTHAVSVGDLRGLPIKGPDGDEFALFDEPQTREWLKRTRAQLVKLLTPSTDVLTIDPEWLDAPLMEAIWNARQKPDRETKPKPIRKKVSTSPESTGEGLPSVPNAALTSVDAPEEHAS